MITKWVPGHWTSRREAPGHIVAETVFLILFLCAGFQVTAHAQETPLRRVASKAKAEGKTSVTLGTPIGFYAEATGLRKALSTSLVVLAEPLMKRVVIPPSEEDILTFIKYRIIERFSDQTMPPDLANEPLPPNVPKEMLPVAADEIIVSKLGGSAEFAGVRITTKEQNEPADLMREPRQLLFLMLRGSGKLGDPIFGVYSFYAVPHDAPIRSMAGNDDHDLGKDLESLGDDPLPQLRTMYEGVAH